MNLITLNNNLSASGKVLTTAIVKVKDRFGGNHFLRAFIDNSSEGADITEQAAQLLCLPRRNEYATLTGIENGRTHSRNVKSINTNLSLNKSVQCYNQFNFHLSTLSTHYSHS